MEEKQFYSALKTLEQLEHSFLPRVRGYMFSELLAEHIPRMRESIEKQSRSELTVSVPPTQCCARDIPFLSGAQEYLAKVREASVHIGEVAMHQVC